MGAENVVATLPVDSLTLVLFTSAILYMACLCVVQKKLRTLNRRSVQLDTRKLFVMSVYLVLLVRIFCFITVGALNLSNVKVNYIYGNIQRYGQTDDITGGETYTYQDHYQDFYDKAVAVLFDLPNYIIISTYMLFALVWMEVFVKARFHTFDNRSLRKKWLISYMVFNILLYGCQTLIYALLFLPHVSNRKIRSIFFIASTVVNVIVVTLVTVLYLYLSLKLAGFPYRSEEAKKFLDKMSRVTICWSLARIVWAFSMLFINYHKLRLLDTEVTLWSLLIFILFLLCEVAPIFLALDYALPGALDFDQMVLDDMSMLASGQYTILGNDDDSSYSTSVRSRAVSGITTFSNDGSFDKDHTDEGRQRNISNSNIGFYEKV